MRINGKHNHIYSLIALRKHSLGQTTQSFFLHIIVIVYKQTFRGMFYDVDKDTSQMDNILMDSSCLFRVGIFYILFTFQSLKLYKQINGKHVITFLVFCKYCWGKNRRWKIFLKCKDCKKRYFF